jgi:hypothetical protein
VVVCAEGENGCDPPCWLDKEGRDEWVGRSGLREGAIVCVIRRILEAFRASRSIGSVNERSGDRLNLLCGLGRLRGRWVGRVDRAQSNIDMETRMEARVPLLFVVRYWLLATNMVIASSLTRLVVQL